MVEISRTIGPGRLFVLLLEPGPFDMTIAFGDTLFGSRRVPYPAGAIEGNPVVDHGSVNNDGLLT